MEKICVIKQPAGLGDIFSLQKVCRYYTSAGYDVIYPVLPQLLYIKDYIQYEGLNFISTEDDFHLKQLYLTNHNIPVEIDGTHYLPFEHASQNVSGCVIRAKYKLIGLDWEDWSDYFYFERNYKKENELYYDVLKLNDTSEYNFVNNIFGTRPGSFIKREVRSFNNLPDIIVDYIKDFTIFDWCKVIENANNIYTVDTSFLFIMEKINLKAKNLQMWSRGNTYESIDGLFKLKWNYN
jgi:hypothetical protein